MATYPDDATANVFEFASVGESIISSSDASGKTEFNLPTAATSIAEVLAVVDGAAQPTTSTTLSNNGITVTFASAPNPSSNLTLRVLSLPTRFKFNRKFELTGSATYSNTSATIVNSNTFLINSNTESFALPVGSTATDANNILVFLSGVLQSPSSFTFPSSVYGTQGIDIGDNATQLLLNFDSSNATDESDNGFTDINSAAKVYSSTAAFGSKSLDLNGTSHFLDYGSSTLLEPGGAQPFTLECFAQPDTVSANGTIFARYQDASNYFVLRSVANAKFGFVSSVKHPSAATPTVTELYSNATAIVTSKFFHVAVSADYANSSISLYVNNAKQAQLTAVNYANVFTGNTKIGVFNTGAAGPGTHAEFFNGKVDALRFSKSTKYRTDMIQPMLTAPTKLGGGALGSVDSGDTLELRVFQGTVERDDRFNSMADRKPDRGHQIDRAFDTVVFESQAGYEKRRLRSRRSKRTFQLTYTNLHGIAKKAIDDFYVARSGNFESFTFDLGHINESGTATVRFENNLQIRNVLSATSNLRDNFFTVNFTLKEVFD